MTHAKNSKKQEAVMQTWGRKCQILLFMAGGGKNGKSSVKKLQHNMYMVFLPMRDCYNNLWRKTKLAFQFVFEKFHGQFDWALKIDDDSFIIMENLRLFILNTDPFVPQFYGFSMGEKSKWFNSGGPGYVISAQNLEKLVRSVHICSNATSEEDVRIAECLKLVGDLHCKVWCITPVFGH